MDWRYFEHNKVDRNGLQVPKSLHKGTGTKMIYFFLSNCQFLFMCLYANFCEPEIHSYRLYCVQSTSSAILKTLVPVVHLVGGYLSLCYGRHVTAASLDKDNGMWIRLVIALMFFFERREKHTLNVEI